MNTLQWWSLLGHFALLSLLAIGGAITTAPDMHRYLVSEQSWLSDAQFNASIAIAQASPGPNILFIPLLGWQTGLALGGSYWSAAAGLAATFLGTLLPSTTLTFAATRWLHRNSQHIFTIAIKASLAPISIALLISTAWLLTAAHNQPARDWPLWLLSGAALLLALRTRVHLLWLLGAGALLGALGWV
jgi:chromate transporter